MTEEEPMRIRWRVLHELSRTDGYISGNGIKDLKTILKLRYGAIQKSLSILSNEMDNLEDLLKKTNKLLEEVKDKL